MVQFTYIQSYIVDAIEVMLGSFAGYCFNSPSQRLERNMCLVGEHKITQIIKVFLCFYSGVIHFGLLKLRLVKMWFLKK